MIHLAIEAIVNRPEFQHIRHVRCTMASFMLLLQNTVDLVVPTTVQDNSNIKKPRFLSHPVIYI